MKIVVSVFSASYCRSVFSLTNEPMNGVSGAMRFQAATTLSLDAISPPGATRTNMYCVRSPGLIR